MNEPPDDIKLRLLFILHRGLVEIRLLAESTTSKQIVDLADALELIPGMLKNWRDGDLARIGSMLKTYQKTYPLGGFDFLARLTDRDPLPF